MRKLLYLTSFMLIAATGYCQIPNAGFETWTNMGTYENPASWGTMNNTTTLASVYTAEKATPGSPGSFYMKLTSKTAGPVVVNGVAVSGRLDSTTYKPKSGFPFTLRPQSFTGKWQYMATNLGSLSAYLTKWNTGLAKRDTVAKLIHNLSGMVMSWATFTLNFTYLTGDYPDTCVIVLKSSGSAPVVNDYLWVDNLGFAGSVAGIHENPSQSKEINAFPNPANNEIEFSSQKTFILGDKLIISDILGNVIIEKTITENTFKINTAQFANSTYVYKLLNSFYVQYATGKFTVQH